MRFERFSESLRDALQQAREIMDDHRHAQLDVEHVALAMLRQNDGLTEQILQQINVAPGIIVHRVEKELEQHPKVYGHAQVGQTVQVYITPRVQRLIKHAEEEAMCQNAQLIHTEHVIAALLRENQGAIANVLRELDIDQARVDAALDAVRPNGPTIAEREAHLRAETSRPATPPESRLELLEQQNQYLQAQLKRAEEELAFTRKLLEQEIAQRHWAERQQVERAAHERSDE